MYRQITSGERYTLGALHAQGFSQATIARELGKHPSSISRELRRNSARFDGAYRPEIAGERTRGRRSRSRRNNRFTHAELELVEILLREKFSPEQAAGYLKKLGLLRISHETIYKHVWRDWKNDGELWTHLRCSPKKRRKRYGTYEKRGRLLGKKMITDRPPIVETRQEPGHWEMDTVMGDHASKHCILSLVERQSGYVIIGKLANRTEEVATARASDWRPDLPRPPVSLLGAGHQREYERSDPAVPAKAGEHEGRNPAPLQCNRTAAQHQAAQAAPLQITSGETTLCGVTIVAVQS